MILYKFDDFHKLTNGKDKEYLKNYGNILNMRGIKTVGFSLKITKI